MNFEINIIFLKFNILRTKDLLRSIKKHFLSFLKGFQWNK